MKLQKKYYNSMSDGDKTLEGRRGGYVEEKGIKVGDELKVHLDGGNVHFKVRVLYINYGLTLSELIGFYEPLGFESEEDAELAYKSIYPEEEFFDTIQVEKIN